MAFIVRQISRTADGREIVRPETYAIASIGIGRDAGNEVHLPDLAVDLHHARITAGETGRLTIEAVGGLPFELDGRSMQRAEVDGKAGCELRLGGHLLRLSKDGSDIIVSVERTEALSDASEEKDEIGLFTLKGVLPGRRPAAWTFIGLVLALFLAWPIYTYATSKGIETREAGFHADTMWTSGPLSTPHKSLENNCQACHTEKFVSVTDDSCMVCHKDVAHEHAAPNRIAGSMEEPGLGGKITGFFAATFNKPQGGCVDCHTEHEGAGAMTPTAQKFCTDCHGSLNTRLTDTKLRNAGDFGLDHPQFHPEITAGFQGDKRMIKRVSLDAKPTEDNGLKFPHDIHMSKNNGIARMTQTLKGQQGWGDSLACKDCHTPSADGTRFKPVDMEQDCAMCHDLAFDNIGGTLRTLRHGEPAQVVADLRGFYRSTAPARPIQLSGMSRRRPGDYAYMETAQDYARGVQSWASNSEEAIRAVFSKGGACYDCHVVVPGKSVAAPYDIAPIVQPDRYMKLGWFDHTAHIDETCSSCHKAETSKVATDLLLPDLASCRTCHVGESGSALKAVKTPVNSSCGMCHDYHIDDGAPWRTKYLIDRGKGKRAQTGKRIAAR
jgi:hypothetical protein